MARFKCELRKSATFPGQAQRRWSNVFYVEAANPAAAAAAIVTGWTAHLRNAARTAVWAYEVYATDLAPLTENYVVQAVPTAQSRGTLVIPAATEPYMPKACLSVNLNVASSRPSRKFWRPGLYETDVVNGTAVETVLTNAISTAFAGFVAAMGSSLVDPDGQVISAVGPVRFTTREFGREATVGVPAAPPLS